MATDPRVLLDAAFAAYGDSPPAGYNSTGQTITNDNGLYVTVYRKIGSNEYIVAFRGTEKTIQDINTDVHKGWSQYDDSDDEIQLLLKELLATSSHVDITGHSLGGALAQFALYDLVAKNPEDPFDTNKYSLTTWNALGGEWALKSEREYKPELLKGVSATHYYRSDDLVSRLGRGHVGGECVELRDPERRIAGVVEAHMQEALQTSLETGTGYVKPPAYLPISDSSQTTAAALIGGLYALGNLDTLVEGLLLIEYGSIRSTPLFNSQLTVDLAFLVGSVLMQEVATRFEPDRLPIAVLFSNIAQECPPNSAWLFQIGQGIASFIHNQFQPGGAGQQFLSGLQELGQSMIQGLIQSLSQIDPDRVAALNWLAIRSMVYGPLDTLVSTPLPGVQSLLPFEYLLLNGFIQAGMYSCPLIVDLDGDGVETLSLEALNLHFDHDGNRYAERSGWVSPDDALLVCDLDGNQRIDRGRELFGSQTPLADGSLARNGFEALRPFDRNGDGRIDSSDADWGRLQLWRDRNSNGAIDSGELLSLADAGIASLELAYTNADLVDGQGNQHRQLGSYRTVQGEQRSLVDVWFRVDQAQTIDLAPLAIDPAIARLPNIAGMGNAPSLHQAMQRDGSGQLRQLVEQWLQASPEQRPALIRPLIYRWTGVDNRPAWPGRGLDDIRSLAALEVLLGIRYRDGEGLQVDLAGMAIGTTFEKLCGVVNTLLEAPELLASVLRPEYLRLDPQRPGFHWDGAAVINALLRRYGDQPSDALLLRLGQAMRSLPSAGRELMASFREMAVADASPLCQRLWLLLVDDHLRGRGGGEWLTGGDANELLEGTDEFDQFAAGAGNDIILGKGQDDRLFSLAGDDVLDGGSGNDGLYADDGDDLLIGGLGDDDLQAGSGDDTLIGGKGNDWIWGGAGHNYYCFSPGDGQDVIYSPTDPDHINIGGILLQGNIQASDLRISRQGLALVVDIGLNDRLTVPNFFFGNSTNNSYHPLEFLQLVDGTIWDQATLTHLALQGTSASDNIDGTSADDTIHAAAGDDIVAGHQGKDQLLGDSGHDYLYGGDGDDDLDGGSGNDTLIGGAGNNSYHFSRGGGQDQIISDGNGRPEASNRILLAPEIRPADLRVSRVANALKLSILGSSDSITLMSAFDSNQRNLLRTLVQEVSFADGSIWSSDAMVAMTMLGSDEPEHLQGLAGNDTLEGLGGDDTLTGYGGHDLLLGGPGHDNLQGDLGDDTISAGPGNDWSSGGEGNNTYRFARGDGLDVIKPSTKYNGLDTNTLELGPGINPTDVTVSRYSSYLDLNLSINGSEDLIILENFFRADSIYRYGAALQQVRFQDGSSWSSRDMVDLALTGTAAADTLIGGPDHDRIRGAAGNDTIIGGGGNDTINGGPGSNMYFYSLYDGNDVLASYYDPNTSRQNSLNFDLLIKPADIKASRIGYRLRLDILSSGESITIDDFFRDGNIQNNYNPLQILRFADGTSWNARTLSSLVSNQITGTSADNTLKGGNGDEWLDGLGGNDQLLGLGGQDQLSGGPGNDTLLGGDGDDLLDGGDGLDSASYSGVLNPVQVHLGLSGPQATGGGGIDTLVSVEQLIGGSGGDRLLGNGAANRIDGGDGDDLIDGGAGNDSLIGGNHQAGDSLSYATAEAGVKVSLALTTLQSTGGAGSDLISGFEHLIGSRFNDNLSGSSAANRLDGGDGNDTLQGGAGADSLQGGAGSDLFLYASTSEAGNGSGIRDLICDWGSGDRIDLSAIDARSDLSGNQAFLWIGSAPFSALGQLRYGPLTNGNGLLEGNCSGSLAADFQLELSGAPGLVTGAIAL